MAKVSVYNFISLDGYYKGLDEDISWHTHGEEENEFSEEQLSKNNILLFGRVTYELMASYWPTEEAEKMAPAVAKGMNDAEKIVFSNTLQDVSWNNTRVVNDMIGEVTKLKKESVNDMTILGSGKVLTQLVGVGLVDEFQIMIDTKAIGAGESMFAGIKKELSLTLVGTKVFKSGTILLQYIEN